MYVQRTLETKAMTLRLPVDLVAAVDDMAAFRGGLSRTAYIRDAIAHAVRRDLQARRRERR